MEPGANQEKGFKFQDKAYKKELFKINKTKYP